MRLQLITVFAVATVCMVPQAAAEDRVSLRTDVYTDEWIIVVSPAAAADVDLGERWSVNGSVSIDALSGATQIFSTDVVTAATDFSEVRRGVQFGGSFQPKPTWRLDTSYAVSIEPDHETHAVSAGTEVEVLDRMATLSASYSIWFERVGRINDPIYQQDTLGSRLDLGWTQILARRSVLAFLGTFDLTDCDPLLGCQANPYRFVALVNPEHNRILVPVTERHPHRRMRGAVAARFIQGFDHDLTLHGGYRFYADTWKINGHTLDVSLGKGFLSERLLTRAEFRFAWQEAASFYRDNYATSEGDIEIPEHRTGDRELSQFYDVMGTLRAEYTFPPIGPLQMRANARVSRVYYRYLTFNELPERNAWLIGAGVSGNF